MAVVGRDVDPDLAFTTTAVNALLNDLRLAWRLVAKSPLFTVVVVTTLALGIGLNTAVFSAIDALLLRPLPGVHAPNELVQLYRTYPGDVSFGGSSIPHFGDVRERSKAAFTDVAAWTFAPMNLAASGRPQRVMGVIASANYFSVLGVSAMLGRTFATAEDTGRGAHPVAVLSYPAWQGLFAGDRNIVGRSVIVSGHPYMIIGVTPDEFKGALPIVTPAMWVPLMQLEAIRPASGGSWERRSNNFLSLVARLAPGIGITQANDRVQTMLAQMRTEYPDHYENSGINLVLQSESGVHPEIKKAQVGLSAVVLAVVGILLLIACVNVANLFLARARDRAREMAIRLSLGAGRRGLVRQLLTESLLFATISGIAGLAVAWWAIGLANRVTLPMDIDFRPDLRVSHMVLLFTLGVTMVTGVLFGLAPALQATRPSLIPALKGEAPAGGSRSRSSRGLVMAQTALSIILLVCAGLFLRNLEAASTVDKGFVSGNLLTADVDPGLSGYTNARSEDFYRRLTERLRGLPGVRAVGLMDQLPMSLGGSDHSVSIPGYTPGPNENMSLGYSTVDPGFFEAMGMRIVRGRGITDQDDSASTPALVVNERFAERFWPGQDPLGRTVRIGTRDHLVVGLVPTGKYERLGEDATAYMYHAQAQRFESGMTILVRTTGDPMLLAGQLRAEVGALDPNLPVSNVRSMDSHLGTAMLPARLTGIVLGIFGLLGLVLASVGIYGVMAHSVAQRTREIGIRMAIGAARSDVVRLVMRQGLTVVLIGSLIGMAGALGAAQLIRGVLYGENALDPVTFAAVPVVLIGVAALATWIPARRASAVNPVSALRRE
jgi:macrolide transport system ATP-binding/permease protein